MESGTLCVDCAEEIARATSERCVDCDLSLSECRCIPARIKTARLVGFAKLFFYDPSDSDAPTSRIIYMLKRGRSRDTIDFIAKRIARSIAASGIGGDDWTVTFVPRSRAAIVKYGYDHMKFLARSVAKELGSPCVPVLVHKGNKEQKKLGAIGRAFAAATSYCVAPGVDLNKKKLVLLDDVITTGATLSNCIDCLKRAGASKIFCAVACESRRRLEILE